MGVVWVMFLVDILLYAVIVWYMDNVRPGKAHVFIKEVSLLILLYACE
jgi:hypothetical protein